MLLSNAEEEGQITNMVYEEANSQQRENLMTETEDVDNRLITTTDSTTVFQLRKYFLSTQFVELGVCFLFFVVVMFIFIFDNNSRERPIPYQLLQNSGDYVRNLVYNEDFDGSESVPDWVLTLIGLGAPMLQIILALSTGNVLHVHPTICTYLVAMGLNELATNSVKLYVGYLRPYFYQACQPDDNYEACTEDTSNERKSFPSGHSSTAFCALMLLSMYIHTHWGTPSRTRRVKVNRSSERPLSENGAAEVILTESNFPFLVARLVSVLALAPLGLALYVATSRIVDNKHFPADVVGGAVLGSSLGRYCYGLWFWM